MAVAENSLKPAFYLGDVGWLALSLGYVIWYRHRAARVADNRYVIAHSGSVGAGAWRELFQRVCKLFNDFKCGEELKAPHSKCGCGYLALFCAVPTSTEFLTEFGSSVPCCSGPSAAVLPSWVAKWQQGFHVSFGCIAARRIALSRRKQGFESPRERQVLSSVRLFQGFLCLFV